ncbi:MAG: SRPBCC family protein [Bacteroidetes bacterium]|nr:SRPBCC family protein [Bacteroidota bacterium]
MKYSTTIDIDLPRSRVIELFDNPDNMAKWQPELIHFKHLNGEPRSEGAQTKLRYKMGQREVEMIETITRRNLPEEFSGTYEAKGVWNMQVNFFEELGEKATLWRSESEFRFKGFMKLIAFFMPGSFKKQTYLQMKRFKEFAESEKP